MKILILGVNGFIGHHLTHRILESTDWDVYGMDMASDRLDDDVDHPRMHFFEGDITINKEWIAYNIRKCDVILPLVAIATPATYVREPLRVFELDFEANLPIVRAAVRYKKRLVFPSTSEVYGMCADAEFDPETSHLVYGPINKPRWIYACSKQLLDRVIAAYGMEQGLDYTLFRPFNWIGPGLDSIFESKEGSSRVVTQFLGQIVRGEPIHLVDGGRQKRAFADISDGIEALMCILRNPGGVASGRIFNIGNPKNDWSVRDLAETMLKMAAELSGIRTGRRALPHRRDVVGRLLRQGLPGRPEPAAEDLRHRERPRLEPEGRHGGGTAPDLRVVSHEGARSAIAHRELTPAAGAVAHIALKVDVDTLRGTREGVPRLLDVLAAAGVRATFLWSLGPDHTGWALRRIFRPGFFSKVQRTSVVKHYGLRTLLYGVALPAPDIGVAGRSSMRAVRDAGHECGIHCWDHVLWQDNVRRRDRAWTERQMGLAFARFLEVFDQASDDARRGRMADEPGGVPRARRVEPGVRLGRTRQRSVSPAGGRRAALACATADDAADLRRTARHRRARRARRLRGAPLDHRTRSRPGVHAPRRARRRPLRRHVRSADRRLACARSPARDARRSVRLARCIDAAGPAYPLG